MISSRIFVQHDSQRVQVPSLSPYLRSSLPNGLRFDESLIDPEGKPNAHWYWQGYGMGKGVTHVAQNISVYSSCQKIVSGLHAHLASGFPHIMIDELPRCYQSCQLMQGFGGFTRWVYFTNPQDGPDILGIDFSIGCPPESGCAHSIARVAEVVKTVAWHGVALSTQVILLNWHMTWNLWLAEFQYERGWLTVGDWLAEPCQYLWPVGIGCPRCGQPTLTGKYFRFCARCGCQPTLIQSKKGGDTHVEIGSRRGLSTRTTSVYSAA